MYFEAGVWLFKKEIRQIDPVGDSYIIYNIHEITRYTSSKIKYVQSVPKRTVLYIYVWELTGL